MKIPNVSYPSPNLRYDPAAREVIFERLNPDTGDVTFQVPSRETLREEAYAATGPAAPDAVTPAPPSPPATGPDDEVAVHAAPTAAAKPGESPKGTSISILV